MSREPHYPEDAPVGSVPADTGGGGAAGVPAAGEPRRTKYLAAGAAIGIGSAAIVAALLYANRSRRG